MNKFLFILMLTTFIIGLNESANGRGMTWRSTHDDALNIEKAGCIGCDSYAGDTSCDSRLPILCYSNNTNLPRPPYDIQICPLECKMPSEYYNGWSGGNFFITEPLLGSSLKSASNMDQICTNRFGIIHKY
jgi:hypothetical protein